MNYFVGLKSELDLLNENEAKQRYLEMLASGYKPGDVFVGAPVNVSSNVAFVTPAGEGTQPATSASPDTALNNAVGEVPQLGPDGMSVNPS